MKADGCSKTRSEGDVQQIAKFCYKGPDRHVKVETTHRSPQMYDDLPLRMLKYLTTHDER